MDLDRIGNDEFHARQTDAVQGQWPPAIRRCRTGQVQHSLYDAGYEKDFFSEYQTKPEVFEARDLPERQGLAVFAVAGDGTTFRVRIDTTPDTQNLTTENADGRKSRPIHCVVETIAKFDGQSDSSTVVDVSVQGIFLDYQKAREYELQSLLSKDSAVRENFEDYYKAVAQEKDCDYGENVIVHATGGYGENLLISVIQGQELANVALTEAAMRLD